LTRRKGIACGIPTIALDPAELGGLAALRSGVVRESAQRKAIAPATAPPVFLPQGTPGMPWPARLV
jgi:hypothetical protein